MKECASRPLPANQRPGSRSWDLKWPIRGRLTTSPWRGVNQSQIPICSLVSAQGERSRIETCGENRETSLSLLLCIQPPSLAIVQLLFCLVKNAWVIVSLHSSKNWVSCIICLLQCKSHYQHETKTRLRLHYSAITVPGKILSYKFLDYLVPDIPTLSSLLPCSDHPVHVSHHTPGHGHKQQSGNSENVSVRND